MYIVNKDGFLVDVDTGEVVDDMNYRLDYSNFTIHETLTIKKIERNIKVPKVDIKKYLASLLPQKLKEEFLSRVSETNNKAEIFAHFLVLCREYGIIFDFNKLREKLGISKISLRRARKKIILTSGNKLREQVDRIFFEIADTVEREYWLAAVLLAIEYKRRQMRVDVEELKRHLQVEIPKSNNYTIYRLLNGKNSLVLVYPYFAYMTCPHGFPAKIDYTKKYFFVRHLGRAKKHDYCFTITTKKVEKLLNIMEYHYEAVKNSQENELQLSEEH